MKKYLLVLFSFSVLMFQSCNKYWDDHYNSAPPTTVKNLWDALKEDSKISKFVSLIEQNRLDTLFRPDKLDTSYIPSNPYTLFIPSNSACDTFLISNIIDTTIIKYHMCEYLILINNITDKQNNNTDKQKIQTLSKKFVFVEKTGSIGKFDDYIILEESPLFRNGKYYIIEKVATPRPNLYDYFGENNPFLKDYIDSKDSFAIDYTRSKPTGIDQNGNTEYDTIFIKYNTFEERFFKVSAEYRNRAATIVFPLEKDYNNALTDFADFVLGKGKTYLDVPLVWQNDIFIPYLLEQGVFENYLEPLDFLKNYDGTGKYKIKNILGDTIKINYNPINKKLCSNGYAYNYANFQVPDTFKIQGTKFEAEKLCKVLSDVEAIWDVNKVKITSDIKFIPKVQRTPGPKFSNDSIFSVDFGNSYKGKFEMEFYANYLMPREFRFEIKVKSDRGGIFDIYVNDVQLKRNTSDLYTLNYKIFTGGPLRSVDPKFHLPTITNKKGEPLFAVDNETSFIRYDYKVKIENFGKPKIRIVYRGPYNNLSTNENGLVIDYIWFAPFL